MKIDLTKEEIEISINLLNQVNASLDNAKVLLNLREKYKQVLEKGENK